MQDRESSAGGVAKFDLGATGGARPYPSFHSGATPPERTPAERELDRLMETARINWGLS